MAARRGPIHDRLTAAIYADPMPLTLWARRLELTRSTLNHRLSGRTPWTLDEALVIAMFLRTNIDAIRDGSYRIGPPRSSHGVTRPHGRNPQ